MSRWLLVVVLIGGTGWAAPPAGLSPGGETLWQQAETRESRGQLDEAAALYGQIFRVESLPAAAVAQSRVLTDAGRLAEAESVLDQVPNDLDAQLARVLLQIQQGRVSQATRSAERLLAAWGSEPEVVRVATLAWAEQDPEQAQALLELWLGFSVQVDLDADQAAELATRVHDAWRQVDQLEKAEQALVATGQAVPGAALRLERVRDRTAMAVAAARLGRVQPVSLTTDQRSRLLGARSSLADGDLQAARAQVEALAREVPLHPEVRGLRAEVRRRLGDIAGAEQDLLAAEALDPLDARWPAALGTLLDTHYAGRFPGEVAAAWRRSLTLEPLQPDLELRLADHLARSGRPDEARATLARMAAGPQAEGARQRLDDLDRERQESPQLAAGPACEASHPAAACSLWFLAAAHHRRNAPANPITQAAADRDVALEAIEAARLLEPDWVQALNLHAAILRSRHEALGDEAAGREARRLLRRSLEVQPAQPDVEVLLGKLLELDGDHEGALAAWRRAVALDAPGGAAAHVYLAEERWHHGDLWATRAHLAAWRAAATPAAVQDPLGRRAERLARQVDGTLQALAVALGAVLLLVLLVPILWLRRRALGQDVAALLARAPSSWRDVARIAASIRHEVLKHHTSALDAVADALEAGDDEPAAWFAERVGPGLDRLDRYVGELEELGRRHGVRLDLRRRDPIFAPLLSASSRLRAAVGPLRRGSPRVVPELRRLSAVLHGEVYPTLGRLVRRTCLVPLDAALVRQAWRDVRAEPSAQGRDVPELDIEEVETGLWVRAWRDDLHDVLVNLLRNALAATLDQGSGRLGVVLEVEEDPVLFSERVVIRIRDDAPRTISTAMIRSRYIERGLGLTVDQISRCGGSIHVEDEPGYSKAVVVRLPRAELGPDEEDG